MLFKRQSSRLLQALRAELAKADKQHKQRYPGVKQDTYTWAPTGPQGGYIGNPEEVDNAELLDKVGDRIQDIEQDVIAKPKEALLKFRDTQREKLSKAKTNYRNNMRYFKNLRRYHRKAMRAARRRNYQQKTQWAGTELAKSRSEVKNAMAMAKKDLAAGANQARTQALLQLAQDLYNTTGKDFTKYLT